MTVSTIFLLLACAVLPCIAKNLIHCTCDEFVDCSDLSISTFDNSEIPCISHMSTINLSFNFLRHFPDSVSVYENVNMSNNRLKTLDTKVDQRMDVLDVSFNSLTKIDLSDKFFSLRKLYAAGNMLSFSSDYLKGHCNINFLDVSESMVESLDPVTHCPALSVLLAPHNVITNIPDRMGTLKRLVRLDLSYNKLTEVSRLPRSLETLDLSHNEITTVSLSSFEGLTQINKMDLKYNRIATVWDRSFVGLKKLSKLDLSHNLIHSLTDATFDGLLAVSSIVLSDNRLEQIGGGTFEHLSALKVIELSNNILTHVPALRLDRHVIRVDLSLNDIRKVDDEAVVSMLADPATKRILVLTANPIRGDDSGVQNLIFQFSASCSEIIESNTRKLIEEWRVDYNFGESSSYRDFGRMAYSQCPCAGISLDNALIQICVSEAAAGWSGKHWLSMSDDDDDDDVDDSEDYRDEL